MAVMLFTRDLRVHDNPALAAALAEPGDTVALFVLDSRLLGGDFASPNRLNFLLESLRDLDHSLGGRLVVRHGDPATEAARVAREVGAATIHLTADYSAYARRRQTRLRSAAGPGVEVVTHGGHAVVEPGAVLPGEKDHFAVFTPFHRRWLAAEWRQVERVPDLQTLASGIPATPLPPRPEGCAPSLPRGGETPGRARLEAWKARGVLAYADLADDLGADATSRLSPYLHLGCISALETVRGVLATGGPGAEAFARQLCWRDFHLQVLAARPDMPYADYRPRGAQWASDGQALDGWKRGQTGVPLVDAAMRQLLVEGWIANRARLVAASYLVKNLGLDWRLGAAHFMKHLVDGDLASNSGNWQWVAGTGNNPRPNQALNPWRQAERFDGRGEYVSRHLGEGRLQR